MSTLLVQQYLDERADLVRVSGDRRESVVREAFKSLLRAGAERAASSSLANTNTRHPPRTAATSMARCRTKRACRSTSGRRKTMLLRGPALTVREPLPNKKIVCLATPGWRQAFRSHPCPIPPLTAPASVVRHSTSCPSGNARLLGMASQRRRRRRSWPLAASSSKGVRP